MAAGITRVWLIAQLHSLAEERQGRLNDLHRIAGAETIVQAQLAQLDAQEQQAAEAERKTRREAAARDRIQRLRDELAVLEPGEGQEEAPDGRSD